MKIVGLLVFVSLVGGLYADWNEDFDLSTQQVMGLFKELSSDEYMDSHLFFMKGRERLLRDSSLVSSFRLCSPREKFMECRGDFICKKRTGANIKDFFAWELARILGDRHFVVPAFPMEIGGKLVVVQKKELFACQEDFMSSLPDHIVKTVSLENFWKAFIMAYILGYSDLSSKNIGVNQQGKIRFFDNEASFKYELNNKKKPFDVVFWAQAFDWPQYRAKIDQKLALRLKKFIKGFDSFEGKLSLYSKVRGFSVDQEKIKNRLKKVRFFRMKEGVSFFDFYQFAFPELTKGLDSLVEIVEESSGRKVGHGSAISFIVKRDIAERVNSEQFEKIRRWVECYVKE